MRRLSEGALPLVARIFLCLVFIPAAISKSFDWAGNAAYMRAHGIPLVAPLLAAALAVEVLGPLCVLVGYRARAAALVMALYLVPVSLLLHRFGQTEFLKNVGILGGLLMLVAFGPGSWSLDARRGYLHALKTAPPAAK